MTEALTDLQSQVEALVLTIEQECTTIAKSKALRAQFEELRRKAEMVHKEYKKLQVTAVQAVTQASISVVHACLGAQDTIDAIIDRLEIQESELTSSSKANRHSGGDPELSGILTPVSIHSAHDFVAAAAINQGENELFNVLLRQISDQFNRILAENQSGPSTSNQQGTPKTGQTHKEAMEKMVNNMREKFNHSLEANQSMRADRPNENDRVGGDSQNPLIELKLDKIQLPMFDGDLTNWIAFRDQYTDLVHANPKLTTVTKFYQLKSHLKGLALESINGFQLSSANYETAWMVIKKRYDKPDQIVDEYLLRFQQLPYLTAPSAVSLIQMVNRANQMLRVLPTLGVKVKDWDTWVMFNLKSRLDRTTLRKWMDQIKLRQNVKLGELLEFLEVEASECIPTEAEKLRPIQSKFPVNKQFKRRNQVATTMHVTERKCEQCKGDHPIFRCPIFMALPVTDRIKKIKIVKLCIRCLREHAHPADCKFGACPVCQKDHNSLLCYKKEKEKATAKSTVANVTHSDWDE